MKHVGKTAFAFAAVALACAAQAGSLKWYKSYDTAVRKALKAGKPIFMLSGRESCYNTTTTRDRSCESSQARAALGKYILWFCNCDEQRDELRPYADGLGGFTLPLTCVINPYDPEDYAVRETGLLQSSEVVSLLRKGSKKVFRKVTFDGNGGTPGTKSRNVLRGGQIGTLPKATRKGYTLKGWFAEDGEKIYKTDEVDGKVTCYAQWKRNEYTIKFSKNGGKGGMEAIVASYGKKVTLPACAFKRSGYKFLGWAKTKSGSVAYKNKAGVKSLTDKADGTVTLYAVWKKK
ncbi:MAG: InlB B-repeat-containing protein [Kiritimatiellae bacterium]|nr:InlB B-repeat-containing protein [Kiritimatiellia bacterium]